LLQDAGSAEVFKKVDYEYVAAGAAAAKTAGRGLEYAGPAAGTAGQPCVQPSHGSIVIFLSARHASGPVNPALVPAMVEFDWRIVACYLHHFLKGLHGR